MFQLTSKVQEVERELNEVQQEEARTQRKQGELEAAHTNHQKDITLRNTKMAELVQEFSFSGEYC